MRGCFLLESNQQSGRGLVGQCQAEIEEDDRKKTPLSILRSPTIRGLMLFGSKSSRKSETENVFGLSPRRLNTETEPQHGGGKFFPVIFGQVTVTEAGVGKYLNLLSPLHYIKRRSNGGERVKEPEDFGASPSGKWWIRSPIDKVKQKLDVRRSRSRLGVMDRRSAVFGCSPSRRIDESSEQRKDGEILFCTYQKEIKV